MSETYSDLGIMLLTECRRYGNTETFWSGDTLFLFDFKLKYFKLLNVNVFYLAFLAQNIY